MDVLFVQVAGNAQIGIHGAFGIRRYHHQAFTGHALIALAANIGIDTGSF